jgi:Txe/YoeB family toxin of Txe-Axe toxin-antitoxin module
MKYVFVDELGKIILYWQKTKVKKINDLFKDISRNPLKE